MGYYERVATPGLAVEFYTELRYFMTKAADKPKSFFNPGARYPESEFAAVPISLSVPRRWPRSPNSRRPPSPSTSIFWIQASIGVWPNWECVAWSGLGF